MNDAKLYLTLRRPHINVYDTIDESAEMTLGPFDLIEVDFGTGLTLVPSRNGGTGLVYFELYKGGYFPYGRYKWSQWVYWASDEPQVADEFDNNSCCTRRTFNEKRHHHAVQREHRMYRRAGQGSD